MNTSELAATLAEVLHHPDGRPKVPTPEVRATLTAEAGVIRILRSAAFEANDPDEELRIHMEMAKRIIILQVLKDELDARRAFAKARGKYVRAPQFGFSLGDRARTH